MQLIERELGAASPHQGRHVEPDRRVAFDRDPLGGCGAGRPLGIARGRGGMCQKTQVTPKKVTNMSGQRNNARTGVSN